MKTLSSQFCIEYLEKSNIAPDIAKSKCAKYFFISPTPTLMAFTGVTNAHGPSPKPTACRSPSCSLTTASKSIVLCQHWRDKLLLSDLFPNKPLRAYSGLSPHFYLSYFDFSGLTFWCSY